MEESKGRSGLVRRGLFGASAVGAAVGAAASGGLGLLAPRGAMAQTLGKSRLQLIKERGRLIVGTGSTNPPWHFEDANGQLQGMDIDLARLLAKNLFDDPTKVEFVLQGSDARIPSLITDKVDIVIQWMTVTAGRAQQVEFTVPYYREGVALLVLARGGKYKKFDEIKAAGSSVTIGGTQNVFLEDWVRKALPEAKVDAFESPDATLQALNARRVDAYLADQSAARWLMQQAPGRFIDSGYGWLPNSYASAVKPGDPVWLNWVNTVYKEAMMGVDFDYFAASYKKWFGIELPTPKVGFPTEFA
ncbi:transporter substrate-binding domain-containing protein [Roseomonas marmotae]|uniref:Transporter substrate-binding domain-containing protein n=1 Tax=Roseomonas marmotae TaxID=2768161 RepID=A0ABS3KI88_9PROT|nr:transporter substrate-binding domain-containing protein [Roseomonas marmotae]MBO1076338.1 transporter substrate-binding domain-containing protein [Roseomonas marmotae]QTI80573.1 transporter substrate-binding domain-containing protein [Roseomonas marmotae]